MTPYLRPISINLRAFARFSGAIILVCLVIQVFLGSSLWTIFWDLLANGFGLYTIICLREESLGGMFLICFLFGNLSIATVAKTILLQPLDSFLYSSDTSFFVEFVGVSCLCLAVVLVDKLNLGRPIIPVNVSSSELWKIVIGSVVLGLIGWIFSGAVTSEDAQKIGGLSLFADFLTVAISARVILLMRENQRRLPMSPDLLAIIVLSIFLGFVNDRQTDVGVPIVVYFLTIFFYNGEIYISQILILLSLAFLFADIIAPLIHVLRYFGAEGIGFSQRVDLIITSVGSLIEGGLVSKLTSATDVTVGTDSYLHYFGPDGAYQLVLGRYASVQQIDPIVWAVQQHGLTQFDMVGSAIKGNLPSFLVNKGSDVGAAFVLLLHYGFVSIFSGKFPTLPLLGELYCLYGIYWLAPIAFLTFAFVLAVLKKSIDTVRGNFFSPFLLVQFVSVYANQADFGEFFSWAVRNIPEILIILILLKKIPAFRNTNRLQTRFN